MASLIDSNLLTALILALTFCLAITGWPRAPEGCPSASLPLTAPPQRLGPYQLGDKIGQGAMGEVYRAHHVVLGGWRAVKLLPRGASERERERFEKEARLGAALRHPNAVSIYERGQAADGTRYYAMELLEGQTLQQLVEREGQQPPERVIRILMQLCSALEGAHGLGLVHRDVKPDNVLLTGEALGLVKLIDFGLVERIGELARAQPLDAVVGTPLYLSPESIVAPETVDARSDLYGLGALAYFLLCGAPVFQGKSVVEVCSHHLHTTPEPPSARIEGGLPVALERCVLACLAKDPAARPRSAADLQRRLQECLDDLDARRAVGHLHVRRAQRLLDRLDEHLARRGKGSPLAA